MPFWKLTIAYDGTEFSGWQAQPERRTVQGVVKAAWREITGENPRLSASSRTDAGVHAVGQVLGVETQSRLGAEKLFSGINAKLPDDVVLVAVDEAPVGFHATRDAVGKHYRYQIHNQRSRPLLDRRQVWHVTQPLDAAAMHRSGQAMVGEHDFASFQSAGSERETTIRTISLVDIQWSKDQPSACLWIDVQGDGFLYNMVRIIVGTLVEVGLGKRAESWPAEVIAARDRSAAGRTAPPHGLMLLRVEY